MSAAPMDLDPPDETSIVEPRLEELSPGERHLESLRGKLTNQQTIVQGEREKTETTLAETRRRIDFLKEQAETLKGATLTARDTMNQAMGLAYALRETVVRLRQQETGEREGGGVGELRMLVEAEMHRARELAVQLVGDHPYTDEFLKTAVIDEGKAGGLSFEIKNDFEPKLNKRMDELSQALHARVPRNHPEHEKREHAYQEAENGYRNASADLVGACNRRDGLLEQIKHSLSTIAALQEAVLKADRVAVRIEEQGKKHEREDLVRASAAFTEKTTDTDRATDELQRGKQNEQALQQALTQFMQREERLTEAIGKVSAAANVYGRGLELHSVASKFGVPLLRIKSNLERNALEAKTGIDPTVLQIGDSVRTKIDNAIGYLTAEADTAYSALERAVEKLQELFEKFEGSIAAADTNVSEENLNWEAMGKVFEEAEELDRFLKNEWPNLKAGSLEGAEGIEREAREKFAKVLEPLAVLRRACGEIQEGRERAVERVFPEPPAAAAAASPAATADDAVEIPATELEGEGEKTPPETATTGPTPAPAEPAAAPAAPVVTETQPLPRRGGGQRRGAQEE